MAELGVALDGLGRLGKKVAEELSNPRQFLEKERRQKLMDRAKVALKSLLAEKTSFGSAKEKIESGLRVHDKQGMWAFICESVPVVGISVPQESDMSFWHSELDEAAVQEPAMLYFSGPTNSKLELPGKSRESYFPSEGFTDGKNNRVPFKNRRPEDEIQHGGIFFDQQGKMEILDYSQLRERQQSTLGEGERLMEANWFLDDSNKDEVLSRRNLQIPLPFNAVGVMSSSDKSNRYFFVSGPGSSQSFAAQLAEDPNVPLFDRDPQLTEVAALAQIMTEREGYQHWALAGTEFNEGGARSTEAQAGLEMSRFRIEVRPGKTA